MTIEVQIMAAAIVLSALHLVLRLSPIWNMRDRGCDAFYFLQAAEAFRARRRLPIVLPPYYLLEPQRQGYPPVTAMLLGMIPDRWVKRYHWTFNAVIEIVSLVILVGWVGSQYGIAWATVAGVTYSANASLTNEFSALTSRSLALAITNIFLVVAYLGVQGNTTALILGIVCATILLYTHKLSAQLLWFVTPVFAIVFQEPRWLIYIPAAYAIAYTVAPSVFADILQAHWDIVAFWSRNWPRLGAHPIRQSQIYGNSTGGAGDYYRRHDLRWLLTRIGKILDYNAFIILVPFMAAVWTELSTLEQFALGATVGTYLWGIATYVLKPLRSFGEGNKYFKYALVPSLVLMAAAPLRLNGLLFGIIEAFCTLWTAWAYIRVWQSMHSKKPSVIGQLTPALSVILDRISTIDGARILCLPFHLSELTAYRTRRQVLWGTHSLGLKDAEPMVPVFQKPIEHFVSVYGLTHMIVDETYVTLPELKLRQGREVMREGNYLLWGFATA